MARLEDKINRGVQAWIGCVAAGDVEFVGSPTFEIRVYHKARVLLRCLCHLPKHNDIRRKQLEAQLISRALEDAAFRQELVSDPKAVFPRELGLTMPEHITVQVLEESPSTVYIVLPQAVAAMGAELSDAELEAVAGGWTGAAHVGCV